MQTSCVMSKCDLRSGATGETVLWQLMPQPCDGVPAGAVCRANALYTVPTKGFYRLRNSLLRSSDQVHASQHHVNGLAGEQFGKVVQRVDDPGMGAAENHNQTLAGRQH
jgi:hypothetical protein